MERCWFVLKQKHYPPPEGDTGPIQLGHLIPDLKHLDQVINNDPAPHPFPPHMVIYPSVLENLTWQISRSHQTDGSIGASVPLPVAAGLVSAGGEVGVAFQKSVSNFWSFEKLDSRIIQPTEAYIRASLQTDIVQRYIQRHRTLLGKWSLFMITGLAIARSARGMQEEGKDKGVHGGPSVSVAGLLDLHSDVGLSKSNSSSSSFGKASDFVWAIQVTRIAKSMLSSEWTYETYVKGATYGVDEEEDVAKSLQSEGFPLDSIYITEEEDVLVLPCEESDNKGVFDQSVRSNGS